MWEQDLVGREMVWDTGYEDALLGNVMDKMDADLLRLVKNWLDSFVKWDVLRFLCQQPDAVYPADALAQRIRRDRNALEAEVTPLIRAGLVGCYWMRGQLAFALAADPAARQLAAKFVRACEDRYFRMKVLYHILRNMPVESRDRQGQL
ncbi:MAG: hypothetical protein KKA73_14965 [Chloroflexi bacterium]|nr:hypothetical protein [Chloroflexota bacterium]MBU1748988.1 hypothetical protein [Chloroflexota bacterium]